MVFNEFQFWRLGRVFVHVWFFFSGQRFFSFHSFFIGVQKTEEQQIAVFGIVSNVVEDFRMVRKRLNIFSMVRWIDRLAHAYKRINPVFEQNFKLQTQPGKYIYFKYKGISNIRTNVTYKRSRVEFFDWFGDLFVGRFIQVNWFVFYYMGFIKTFLGIIHLQKEDRSETENERKNNKEILELQKICIYIQYQTKKRNNFKPEGINK